MKTTPHFGSSMRSSRKAFTLIELLVVIAIIAMLVGLLLPAIWGVRQQVKKTRAQATVGALATAVQGYYTEYGRFPPPSDGLGTGNGGELTTTELYGLFRLLQGENVDLNGSSGGNPRGIIFLEVKRRDQKCVGANYKEATAGTTNIVDPWGNSYRLRFDHDGDNLTEVFGSSTAKVRRDFAVWSTGPDMEEDTTETDGGVPTKLLNMDNLTSWK
jgi:prepilin-type N-terminal cleavage/methylation domain-containing protein